MPKSNAVKSPGSVTASSRSELRNKIINYIRAGYPGLYLVSHEEQRMDAEMVRVTQELKYSLVFWSVVDGLIDQQKGQQISSANDPLEALIGIQGLPEKVVVVLKDFHLFLADPNPVLIRQFKDVLQSAKTHNKTIIIAGCRLCLPPELEREITVVEFSLPDKEQLGVVLSGIIESANLGAIAPELRERVLDAAGGLTTIEAENAFALSVVQTKGIDPEVVAKEKAQAVKKNGLLEIIETSESLESIGGLDVLKDWLLKRKLAFSQRAIQYGLPALKGVLILGLPGTGKSLSAKATAKVFGVPLLKLDAGKIFAGIVGQSESNLRTVIQTAEAIAPCVLWLDEVEKGFSGSRSSNATDGGTSARVFGSFISWMQEKKSAVFIVATANDVSQLPPEMLRKGRFGCIIAMTKQRFHHRLCPILYITAIFSTNAVSQQPGCGIQQPAALNSKLPRDATNRNWNGDSKFLGFVLIIPAVFTETADICEHKQPSRIACIRRREIEGAG